MTDEEREIVVAAFLLRDREFVEGHYDLAWACVRRMGSEILRTVVEYGLYYSVRMGELEPSALKSFLGCNTVDPRLPKGFWDEYADMADRVFSVPLEDHEEIRCALAEDRVSDLLRREEMRRLPGDVGFELVSRLQRYRSGEA